MIRLDRARELDASGGGQEPFKWEARRYPNGLNRYMTQRKYEAQTPAVQAHYKPICEACATPRAAEAGDWLPIESAPRDGTRIILGRPDEDDDGGGISVCGYWLEELDDGVDYMGNDGGFTDVDYQVFQPGRSFGAESYRYAGKQPTHWRPLPPAPQAAMGAVGAGGGE